MDYNSNVQKLIDLAFEIDRLQNRNYDKFKSYTIKHGDKNLKIPIKSGMDSYEE